MREELGRGAFGQVLRVLDRELGREVALKLLEADLTVPDMLERFEQEARACAALRHPHVLEVYDHGIAEGRAWIASPLVEGPTLEQLLASRGALPLTQVLAWGSALADALAHVHAKGIVHRDLKPANVLLRDGEHPLLIDFGVARVAADARIQTAQGMLLGTPAYMAPEVVLGAPARPAADQFSLAACLFEMAYGVLAEPETDLASRSRRAIQGKGPRIPEEATGRYPALEPVLRQALDPDPAFRFPGAAELRDALRAAATGADTLDLARRETGERLAPVARPDAPTVEMDAPPSKDRTGSPPPRLPVLPLAAGLGCLGLTALMLAPRAARPPPPRPIAEAAPVPQPPGPLDRARAEFRDATARLTRSHRRPDGSLDLLNFSTNWVGHIVPRAGSLGDARLPVRWSTFLRTGMALLGEAHRAGALEDPEVVEALDRDLHRFGAHLLRDLHHAETMALEARLPGREVDLVPEGFSALELYEVLRKRRKECLDRARRALVELAARPGGATDPGLALRAMLSVFAAPTEFLDLAEPVRARLRDPSPGPYRAGLASALLTGMRIATNLEEVPCPLRREILTDIREALGAPRPDVPERARLEILAEVLEVCCRTAARCPPEGSAAEREAFEVAYPQVREGVPRIPFHVIRIASQTDHGYGNMRLLMDFPEYLESMVTRTVDLWGGAADRVRDHPGAAGLEAYLLRPTAEGGDAEAERSGE